VLDRPERVWLDGDHKKSYFLANALCARPLAKGQAMKSASKHEVHKSIEIWNLNAQKSRFHSGPGPRRLTIKIQRLGDEEKVTADGENAIGQPTHSEYNAKYDGHEYPIAGSATADTVSLRRIDALTTERKDKRGGNVVEIRTRKLSQDGKTLTVTFNGAYAPGKSIKSEMVFERT
jgi:hypothetical protein